MREIRIDNSASRKKSALPTHWSILVDISPCVHLTGQGMINAAVLMDRSLPTAREVGLPETIRNDVISA